MNINRVTAGRMRVWQACLGPAVLAAVLLAGCGGTPAKKQDAFFTSGNREADQRASQRLAKSQEISGSRNGSGSKADTAKGGAQQVEERRTLYDRLGGETGLQAIVEDFTPRVMQDPRVNWDRKGVRHGGLFSRDTSPVWNPTPGNVANLKKHMAQFLALASGGPAQYQGKEIRATHENMQITNAEFDAAVGDLKASLDRLKIADAEQKELLAIVESTRPQIVTQR